MALSLVTLAKESWEGREEEEWIEKSSRYTTTGKKEHQLIRPKKKDKKKD